MVLSAMGLSAVPVAAGGGGGPLNCNSTVNGGKVNGNVTVNPSAVCILNGVNVTGNVLVGNNAYFEANGAKITGNVVGAGALTIYVWGGTLVSGNVTGLGTAQLFVYDSNVQGNIAAVSNVSPGYGHFQVCGSHVGLNVGTAVTGPDVLIGDPAAGCGANTIQGGDLIVADVKANSELYVIGNDVPFGDISIFLNTGTGPKLVNGNNAPHGDLTCQNNSGPFDGSANGTVGDLVGACAATSINGNDIDD